MKVKFLSTDEVLAIQERLIDRFGGTHGVRDPGILESALYRPRSGYYQDLAEMAAALFDVNDDKAFKFLMKKFDTKTCDYENLLPWIRESIKKM